MKSKGLRLLIFWTLLMAILGGFFFVGPVSNDGGVDGHRHGFNRRSHSRCNRHSDQHRDGPDANNEDRGKWPLWILAAFPGHL